MASCLFKTNASKTKIFLRPHFPLDKSEVIEYNVCKILYAKISGF